MIPVIVIRPQPGCDETISRLKELGINATGCPLFEVAARPWDPPDRESFDALILGSANAIRHGGDAVSAYAGTPTYAVGAKTAEAAREVGLDVIATGEGGLQELLGSVRPEHRRLLRLAGEKRVELIPPETLEIAERIVYASTPIPMPQELDDLLADPTLILLHSAEAARHFTASCDAKGIDRSIISLATIGPRVSDAAGRGWKQVRSAAQPNEDALLALAEHMCQEASRSHNNSNSSMQDQAGIKDLISSPAQQQSSRRALLIALIAFVLGSLVVLWAVWRGYLDPVLPERASDDVEATAATETLPEEAGEAEGPAEDEKLKKVSTVEARVAMMEDRLSRLNLQANAASGNAARAENLLIAFAARRMTDRGQPLGYLADQLRLRFTNAQPRAVRTIIDFAEQPVTVDELSARLEALGPQLSGSSDDESFWDSATREISSLFTIRREPSALHSPAARLDRARVMLMAGKIPEAISQVERLPKAELAQRWISDARRYAAAQDALNIIETAAMLEPSKLQDSEGNLIEQPSPIAKPTETPDQKKSQ